MQHVGLVESVVSQFVKHYLVSREIGDAGALRDESLTGKEECGLRELAAVKAILGITYRADSDDDLHRGITLQKYVNGSDEVVGALLYGQLLLLEKIMGTLLTVVNNLASLLQTVDVVGTEGKEGDMRSER